MSGKLKCWYCGSKSRIKGRLFCKDCEKIKVKQVGIIHQGSVTVGINRKPV